MKQNKATSNRNLRRGAAARSRRTWMPVTDNWIGSFDARLWNRSEEMSFDWSATDPWTHRAESV